MLQLGIKHAVQLSHINKPVLCLHREIEMMKVNVLKCENLIKI